MADAQTLDDMSPGLLKVTVPLIGASHRWASPLCSPSHRRGSPQASPGRDGRREDGLLCVEFGAGSPALPPAAGPATGDAARRGPVGQPCFPGRGRVVGIDRCAETAGWDTPLAWQPFGLITLCCAVKKTAQTFFPCVRGHRRDARRTPTG